MIEKMPTMDCDISIRVTFPEDITAVLRKEKERFVTQYGSSYKSEPHITLYLDHYTEEGYPELLSDLRSGLRIKPLSITLLPPKVRPETHRHRNLYIMDVSNKERLDELQKNVEAFAIPYQSPLVSEKKRLRLERQGIATDGTRESLKAHPELAAQEKFDPHITLGEIDFDKPRADIETSKENLAAIMGKDILISGVSVFFYGKKEGDEKAKLIEEINIPFIQ